MVEEIRYSADFYVNDFRDKGIDYAKNHVETFIRKPPRNLTAYLEKQNHFGKENPAFQAVIIGEPRVSLFGKPQAAVLMIHSNYIAYTTTSDPASPVGITYGFATFDNEIAVSDAGSHLQIRTPYETFLVGVDSLSKEEDYRVITALMEENKLAIERFYQRLEKQEEEVIEEMEDVLAEENEPEADAPDEAAAVVDSELTPAAKEKPIHAEHTEEVFVPADEPGLDEEMEELSVDEFQALTSEEDSKPLPVEEEAEVPVEGEEPEDLEVSESSEMEGTEPLPPVETEGEAGLKPEATSEATIDEDAAKETEADSEEAEREWAHILMEKNREGEMEEMKHLPAELKNQLPAAQESETAAPTNDGVDPRFQTSEPIISHNTIPRGFVYDGPVVYASSVRPGLLKNVTPKAGYVRAYQDCIDQIKEDIEAGTFDAVFNLQVTTQSVENYYDVVVTGDAVIYHKKD